MNEDRDIVAALTRAVRVADRGFQETGGSSRHWIREQFIPSIEREGCAVVRVDRIADLESQLADREIILAALAADAGKALLEQLEKLGREHQDLLRCHAADAERCAEFKRLGQQFESDSRKFFEQSCKNLERAAKAEAERDEAIGACQQKFGAHPTWVVNAANVRAAALEEAAKVAEAYEPECEACPRGCAAAIRALEAKP